MYILLAILLFGFLIFIHELGHFLTAKALGVKVNEFSICMGPALWQKTVGETTYSLRCLPIGGYCAMEGEDGESEDPRSFQRQAVWKRLVILAAGSAMNFLTGFVILTILFAGAQAFVTPQIDGFMEGCPIEGENGLMVGDEILAIDGRRVFTYSDLSLLLDRGGDDVYDFTLRRDGKTVKLQQVEFAPRYYEENGQQVLKYGLFFAARENSPGMTLRYAWYSAIDFGRMVVYGLEDLFSGRAGFKDVSGAVGIVAAINESGQAAETRSEGVENVLYFGAFIAVNLAFMNMLPFPALDGGRVFFLLVTAVIEGVTRKKVDPKYENYIHGAGMALLLAFVALITVKDVISLF